GARPVAAPDRVVVGGVVGGGRQVGGQPQFREGLGDHGVEVLRAALEDPGAEGGVQVAQHLVAVPFGGGHRHTDRPDGAVHQVAVPVGQVVALVVQVQAHHLEAQVEGAFPLDLQQPAGGDPGEGAGGVEEAVDAGGGGRGGCHA